MMQDERLTPHFTLSELTHSQTAARLGIDNTPPAPVVVNLRHLAHILEAVRASLRNCPVLISSGYRSPQLNRAIGGASSSAHMTGCACDFTAPGFGTPIEICRALAPQLDLLMIDQLIHEFGSWVHLGVTEHGAAARHMVLTIDRGGTRTGLA